MKLDNRSKWTYSIGSVGRDMAYTLVSMFLLLYIQYTMNLSTGQFAVISVIMVVCLIWDAINDILMGMIIENTTMKWGKFKPWIFIGAILNSLVIILMFTIRLSGWNYVLFFGVTYLLWGMTYTMNDISYYGMLPSLTSDPKERDSLVALMNIFISVGQFSVATIVPMLVAGNAIQIYRMVAIGVAILLVLFQSVTVFGVIERPRRDASEKLHLKGMITLFKRNDQLQGIGIAHVFYNVGSGLLILFGMNFFYVEFGYARGGALITVFTVMYGVGTLLSQVFFTPLTGRFSRKALLKVIILIVAISYLLFLSLGYVLPMHEVLIYALGLVIFFSQGLFNLLMIVMINNTIEYDEARFGLRHDSVISAVRSFAVKFSGAINQGIVALTLILSGIYNASQEISALEQEVSTGLITRDTVLLEAEFIISRILDNQRLILRLGMVILPIMMMVISYTIIKRRYKIDEAYYLELLEEIEQKK